MRGVLFALSEIRTLLRQSLHHAPHAVHGHHGAVLQPAGGVGGPHDDRLIQGQAYRGGVAVRAGLLADDSGGLTDLGQQVVVGIGHHQHVAGVELLRHIVQGAADA